MLPGRGARGAFWEPWGRARVPVPEPVPPKACFSVRGGPGVLLVLGSVRCGTRRSSEEGSRVGRGRSDPCPGGAVTSVVKPAPEVVCSWGWGQGGSWSRSPGRCPPHPLGRPGLRATGTLRSSEPGAGSEKVPEQCGWGPGDFGVRIWPHVARLCTPDPGGQPRGWGELTWYLGALAVNEEPVECVRSAPCERGCVNIEHKGVLAPKKAAGTPSCPVRTSSCQGHCLGADVWWLCPGAALGWAGRGTGPVPAPAFEVSEPVQTSAGRGMGSGLSLC